MNYTEPSDSPRSLHRCILFTQIFPAYFFLLKRVYLSADRQMVMFSATWPLPVHYLAQEFMDPNPVKVCIFIFNKSFQLLFLYKLLEEEIFKLVTGCCRLRRLSCQSWCHADSWGVNFIKSTFLIYVFMLLVNINSFYIHRSWMIVLVISA